MPDRLARQLLEGCVSYHDHYGWERGGCGAGAATCRQTYDPEVIVRSAAEAKARAVVLRNLYFTSTGDAYALRKLVPGIEVIGGIFLNSEVGGINPIAVETAMTYGTGARFVCMATDSAAHSARSMGVTEEEIQSDPVRYVTPFARDGSLKPEMSEVLQLIASNDIALETGILSPEDHLRMVAAARDAGVKRILVTHPAPSFCGMSLDDMHRAVAMGALIEFTWIFYTHAMSYFERRYPDAGPNAHRTESVGTAFDQIRALGPENCVLSTDFGTLELPTPIEGLREFVFCLLDLGMTPEEIAPMVRENPARLMGL